MSDHRAFDFPILLWGAIMLLVSVVVSAQESSVTPDSTAAMDSTAVEVVEERPAYNPNPTRRPITPRQGQSAEQQRADALECFDATNEETGWNPYEGWAELVDAGYAVAVTREEMEEGLVSVAWDGAVTGSVAGDLLNEEDRGAEVGAAVALALELVRSDYVLRLEDPQAQRAVATYERQLRYWEKKYAACLRPKGYAVPSR